MNTLGADARAKKIWFDDDTLWVDFTDGRRLGVPLAYFPRLLQATPKERDKVIISGGGSGLHWDELDEDISVPALLTGVSDLAMKAG